MAFNQPPEYLMGDQVEVKRTPGAKPEPGDPLAPLYNKRGYILALIPVRNAEGALVEWKYSVAMCESNETISFSGINLVGTNVFTKQYVRRI